MKTTRWGKKKLASTTLGNGQEGPSSSSRTHRSVAVFANDNEIGTKAHFFTLNIGRYMRHKLSVRQKYETIFEGKGFVFDDVLLGLLRLSNPKASMSDVLGFVDIDVYKTRQAIYEDVSRQLQHGALCVRIRIFDGYMEKTTCVKAREMLFTSAYHYVTIHGVALTRHGEHGGIMFLVQDSFENRPFKNISLELLREMGSQSIIHIKKSIKMPTTSVFDLDPEDIVTAGGLELQKLRTSRCIDVEGEQREQQKNRELLRALLEPNYVPEWVRRLRSIDDNRSPNDAGLAHTDMVEGGNKGVVDPDIVNNGEFQHGGENGFEVQYEKQGKGVNILVSK